MSLRPTHQGGEYNFPAAQLAEEVPARWTEIVFLDRSTASPARLASYFGGLRFNAVLVDVAHWLLATDHGATVRMFFDPLQQEFRRSRCSPHFVDHVNLLRFGKTAGTWQADSAAEQVVCYLAPVPFRGGI
jgi:hypothetical protein